MAIRTGDVIELKNVHDCGKIAYLQVISKKGKIRLKCMACGKVIVLTLEEFDEYYYHKSRKYIIDNTKTRNGRKKPKAVNNEKEEMLFYNKVYNDFMDFDEIAEKYKTRRENAKKIYEIRKNSNSWEESNIELKKLKLDNCLSFYKDKGVNCCWSKENHRLLSKCYLYAFLKGKIRETKRNIKKAEKSSNLELKKILNELLQLYEYCDKSLHDDIYGSFPKDIHLDTIDGQITKIGRRTQIWFEKQGCNRKMMERILQLAGARARVYDTDKEYANVILNFLLAIASDKGQISLKFIHEYKDNIFKQYYGEDKYSKYSEIQESDFVQFTDEINRLKYLGFTSENYLLIDSRHDVSTHLQLVNSSNNHATRKHSVINLEMKFLVNVDDKFKLFSYKCHYCEDCKVYFDYMSSFINQLDSNGISLSDICLRFTDTYGKKIEKINAYEFKPESYLHKLGYVVGHNGKSANKRREIIDYVIGKNIMTRAEIKSLLNHNINIFSSRREYKLACNHWNDDINYINSAISKR